MPIPGALEPSGARRQPSFRGKARSGVVAFHAGSLVEEDRSVSPVGAQRQNRLLGSRVPGDEHAHVEWQLLVQRGRWKLPEIDSPRQPWCYPTRAFRHSFLGSHRGRMLCTSPTRRSPACCTRRRYG